MSGNIIAVKRKVLPIHDKDEDSQSQPHLQLKLQTYNQLKKETKSINKAMMDNFCMIMGFTGFNFFLTVSNSANPLISVLLVTRVSFHTIIMLNLFS